MIVKPKMIKEKIALVAILDKNGKKHYVAVEDMELAKELYGDKEKRELTLIRRS